MFWFSGKKLIRGLEEETKKSFSGVKKDIDAVGKWIKHLDNGGKQMFGVVEVLKEDLSTVKAELSQIREMLEEAEDDKKTKQVFKKLPVLNKQTAVEGVQEAVQTAVQTVNFYEILRGMTAGERLLILTLSNSEMKLSYEDLALLLAKERSTVRGHVNRIKQKSPGLINEMVEKNGKKRVFVPDEIKSKLAKYAKVRTQKRKKGN